MTINGQKHFLSVKALVIASTQSFTVDYRAHHGPREEISKLRRSEGHKMLFLIMVFANILRHKRVILLIEQVPYII